MNEPKWELLESAKHRNLQVNVSNYNTSENNKNTAHVSVGELSALIHEYPVFIAKDPESGQWQLLALFGLVRGENLFLDDTKWRATYLPMDVQRRPFRLLLPEGEMLQNGHVAIDINSEQICSHGGQGIFDEQGRETEFLQKIKQMFSTIMGATKQTQDILKVAEKNGLIKPFDMKIDVDNKEPILLNGLYSFDRTAVTELKGEALQECHDSGVLQICHLIISSTFHMNKLIRWHNIKHAEQTTA